jgi:hypothetical protein
MRKKIILRLSNEIGNQMFMYASAYSISKKMNRELFLDDETAFLSKKNISKFGLDNFRITAPTSENKYKFKTLQGYLNRKFSIKLDFLRRKKKFYIEKKDKKKITHFDDSFINNSYDEVLFLEGHFESLKYFDNYENEIRNEFKFKEESKFKNSSIFKEINKTVSVGVCIRQNRFNEGKGKNTSENIRKSENYSNEQINYINKATKLIKNKLPKAKFFLWSNDFDNLKKHNFKFDFNVVDLSSYKNDFDIRAFNLFLLSSCKHFIVTPSTFNWWGAWLSKNNEKIITRPAEDFFSLFKVNNKDFWPNNWIKINEKH